MSDISKLIRIRRAFRNVIEGIIEIGKMVGVFLFDGMVDLIDYTIDKIVSNVEKEDEKNDTKHFADGFHEGEWERDINHKPIYDGVYDVNDVEDMK